MFITYTNLYLHQVHLYFNVLQYIRLVLTVVCVTSVSTNCKANICVCWCIHLLYGPSTECILAIVTVLIMIISLSQRSSHYNREHLNTAASPLLHHLILHGFFEHVA